MAVKDAAEQKKISVVLATLTSIISPLKTRPLITAAARIAAGGWCVRLDQGLGRHLLAMALVARTLGQHPTRLFCWPSRTRHLVFGMSWVRALTFVGASLICFFCWTNLC
jgi:hypothetical protein